MKKRSKLFKRVLYFCISIFVIIVVTVVFFMVFTVQSIETNATLKQMEYFPNLDRTLIFFVDNNTIRRHFLNDQTIESVLIEPKYPNTLLITLNKRKEAGVVHTKEGLFKVDSHGFIFDTAASGSAYPVIHLETSDLGVGNNITHNTMQIAILSAYFAKEKGIYVTHIYKVENDSIRMVLQSGLTIIIGSKRTAEDIVSSLQTILKTITIETKTVKEIDFRFEKPFISN